MTLDAPTRALLAGAAAAGGQPTHLLSPPEARAALRFRQLRNPPGPDVDAVTQALIPADDGVLLDARIFTPAAPRGSLVFLHGGGWVLGDLDGFDHYARRLAVRLRLTVVLVDYRLAPEAVYPTAACDAIAALAWADRERGGILPNGPLLVAGDSAGGNLAAVAVGRRETPVAAQILLYPVVDADFDRPSYLDPANQLMVSAETMRWSWDHYAPDAARRSEPLASPLHGALRGLPTTIIATAEHDVLRDEGEEYAERLARAGGRVVHRRFDGQMHGFATMPSLPASEVLLDWIAGEVDRILYGLGV